MESTDYKVRLDVFEGPLDLLLYLIKKDELDIHSVSLESITHQYLDYIHAFSPLDIDLASEFIVMAANLMYLKSRTLLPRIDLPPEEATEDDDPRWELIRQLIEYKKFKDAAGFLSHQEMHQEGCFIHQADMPESPPDQEVPLADASVFDLIKAFHKVIKRFEDSHDFGDIIDDLYTVTDKIEYLLHQFSPGETRQFEELFQTATSKAEIIVTFLALLELMKLHQFLIHQDELLGKITLQRRTITPQSTQTDRDTESTKL